MTQPSQADIFAALQSGSFRSKALPASSPYSAYSDPVTQLTQAGEGSSSSSKTNARKVYCFREGCGSLILLPGAGTWGTSHEYVIPRDSLSPFPPSTPLPEPQLQPDSQAEAQTSNSKTSSGGYGYWHVPDPYSFENIGFSRPDINTSIPPGTPGGTEGRQVKWLICAECDLGPIGWGFEGSKEAWLVADRVRYADQ